MRIVIAFLLLLNLVLYLWGQILTSEKVADPIAPPDIGTLRLRSEVSEVKPVGDALVAQPLPNDGEVSPVGVTAESVHGSTWLARMPEIEARTRLPEVTSQPSAVADNEVFAKRASAFHQPVGSIEITEPSQPSNRIPAESQIVCGQLRWYDDVEAANAWVARLEGLDIWAELINDQVEQRTSYWVLVPPQSNRAAALAKQAELQAMGVEDLWLFRKGPLLNSISLGLFTGNRRAQRRADEIRRLGFEVEVRPKLKLNERYAVAYRTERRRLDTLGKTLALGEPVENQRLPCP